MTIKAKTTLAALSVALMASTAHAGGLDRTTYSPNILFEQGKVYIEGSLARVNPNVSGDVTFVPLGVNGVEDISPNYDLFSAGAKFDITDRIAVAFQTFEAVGSEISYGGPPEFYFPIEVDLHGRAYVGTAKFNITDRVSVFGGVKYLEVGGDATNLLGPGPAAGDFDFEGSHGHGYIIGAAYSIPDIALRVSLTYETAFEIDIPTTATSAALGPFGLNVSGRDTTATIPAAWELYFQTGIAPGTLLFGSIRHTAWSDANITLFNVNANPDFQITDFSDSMTYSLGVGKQITDRLSMSVSGTYEPGDGKPSTLQPTDGKFTLGVGAKYKLTENLELSGGFSHTWLGDNETDLGTGVPEADFEDNHAWAFGTKIAVRF